VNSSESKGPDLFERCIKASRDYEWQMRRDYLHAVPLGWLIITEQQKRELLMSPSMQFVSDPGHLIRRTGALGSLMGMPIHIAEPGDKIPNWLLYGRFTVDMRGDQR
jgi:hypothetical protein